MDELRAGGYGWLRPAGVRAELDRRSAAWTEPPLPAVPEPLRWDPPPGFIERFPW